MPLTFQEMSFMRIPIELPRRWNGPTRLESVPILLRGWRADLRTGPSQRHQRYSTDVRRETQSHGANTGTAGEFAALATAPSLNQDIHTQKRSELGTDIVWASSSVCHWLRQCFLGVSGCRCSARAARKRQEKQTLAEPVAHGQGLQQTVSLPELQLRDAVVLYLV